MVYFRRIAIRASGYQDRRTASLTKLIAADAGDLVLQLP
jgi:hypothetical protein